MSELEPNIDTLDVETPLPALLELYPSAAGGFYSIDDFMSEAGSFDMGQFLRGDRGFVPIAHKLPHNLSVLSDHSARDLRKEGFRPISAFYSQEDYVISEKCRSALSTLPIGAQEFAPIKIFAPVSYSKTSYGEGNRVFIGDYHFWRVLEYIDVIDFDAMIDPVYRPNDLTRYAGGYETCDVDPAWPIGTFSISPAYTVPLKDVRLDKPIFAVRGLEGRFITESFLEMLKAHDLLARMTLRTYHLDPKRRDILGRAYVEGRITQFPSVKFVGTTMSVPGRSIGDLATAINFD